MRLILCGLVTLAGLVRAEPVTPTGCTVGETCHLTDDNFKDLISPTERNVVMEFYATWCGHCKKAKPHLEEAAKLLKDANSDQMIYQVQVYNAAEGDTGGIGSGFAVNDAVGKVKGFPTFKLMQIGPNGVKALGELKDFQQADGESYKKAIQKVTAPSYNYSADLETTTTKDESGNDKVTVVGEISTPMTAESFKQTIKAVDARSDVIQSRAKGAAAAKTRKEREEYEKTPMGMFWKYAPYVGYTVAIVGTVGSLYFFWWKPMQERHAAKRKKQAETRAAELEAKQKAMNALNQTPADMDAPLPDEEDAFPWEAILIVVIILIVTLLLGYFGYSAYKNGESDEDDEDEDLESPEEK